MSAAQDTVREAGLDAAVFRQIFEAYPDGVLLVDGEGRIVLAAGLLC
jgi:PAS domain-containing protein